jgi:hypothetical protein
VLDDTEAEPSDAHIVLMQRQRFGHHKILIFIGHNFFATAWLAVLGT